jgi:transcriptional regulator
VREKRLTITDIARQLGTSTTTVSFVINGKAKEKNISDALIEKVEQLVSELNYQPNTLAKSVRTGKTMTKYPNRFFPALQSILMKKHQHLAIISCSVVQKTAKKEAGRYFRYLTKGMLMPLLLPCQMVLKKRFGK